MKTKDLSPILPLLVISLLFVLNGCYTQLVVVDDDQYSAFVPTPIIIVPAPPIIIIEPGPPPEPVWNPPIPRPLFNPIPAAGSQQNNLEQIVLNPTRDSGNKRGDRNENTAIPDRSDERRESRPVRGGR